MIPQHTYRVEDYFTEMIPQRSYKIENCSPENLESIINYLNSALKGLKDETVVINGGGIYLDFNDKDVMTLTSDISFRKVTK